MRPARWGRRFSLAVVLAAASLLVAAALRGTIVYYDTPSEVGAYAAGADRKLRVSGRVVPGSLRRGDAATTFTITDGRREIDVAYRGAVPGTLREGQDAVVEGVLGPERVLRAERVIPKHSNQYRPGPDRSVPAGDR